MHIALVSRELAPFHGGGVGTYAATVARALARAGHTVELITENRLRYDHACVLEGTLRIHRVHGAPGDAHWLRTLGRFSAAACKRIAEIHAVSPIDVVEFPDTEGAGIGYVLGRSMGAFGARAPACVLSVHAASLAMEATGSSEMHNASDRRVLTSLERAVLQLADGVTCPSSTYAEWTARVQGLACVPEVIRNPLEWPGEAAPVDPTSKTVLYVGRLEPGKGVEDLVRAWSRCGLADRGWTLRLVGRDTRTGPDGSSMRAHLLAQGPESLDVVGPVPRGELPEVFAASSFVVMPSRWENLPYSCAEALASGRAVVVSDAGGTAELLDPDLHRLLVTRAGDIAALGATLERVAEIDAKGLSELGARCGTYVRGLCDPARIAKQRTEYFHRVMAQRAVRRCEPAEKLNVWRELEGGGVVNETRLAGSSLAPEETEGAVC